MNNNKKVVKRGTIIGATCALLSVVRVVKQVSAALDTAITLTISGGAVSIGSTGNFDLGSVTVASTVTTKEAQFTGAANAFFVEDLKGANSGYYTTLQSTNLTGPNGTIASSNVAVKVTSTGTVLLTGAANPRVVVADTLVAYQALNSPVTFIKRDTAANSGVIGKYGSYPFLQVSVPAFQAIGNYTATLTYTLIEN